VAAQFPQWADLPVRPVALDGWDNTTFRLGDELCVRLPSADAYEAQVEKEQRWLPVLASHLPLAIPEPVAKGRPGEGFPREWSIYRWIVGQPACVEAVADPTAFATDLAAFLTALYAIDPRGGPRPGAHSFGRGGSVAGYDAQTRGAIRLLADEVDAETATDAWEAALATSWERAPVWVHGDIAASNLLVVDGRLRAVIDFGCAAVGDPACDLVIAWTFLEPGPRAAFRGAVAFDESTWARARGWALWKALITLASQRTGHEDGDAAARRFGWRVGADDLIDLVLAEHRATR